MREMKIRGPWEMIDSLLVGQSAKEIVSPGGKVVGYIYTGRQDQDNARLVAAAPELFLLVVEILVDRGEESTYRTLERLMVKAQHLIDKIGGND